MYVLIACLFLGLLGCPHDHPTFQPNIWPCWDCPASRWSSTTGPRPCRSTLLSSLSEKIDIRLWNVLCARAELNSWDQEKPTSAAITHHCIPECQISREDLIVLCLVVAVGLVLQKCWIFRPRYYSKLGPNSHDKSTVSCDNSTIGSRSGFRPSRPHRFPNNEKIKTTFCSNDQLRHCVSISST